MSSSFSKSLDNRFISGMDQLRRMHEDIGISFSEVDLKNKEEDVDVAVDDSRKTMQLVKSLPSELSNQIMQNLWEAAFYPGFVYLPPNSADGVKDDDNEKDAWAVRPTLLSLSRAIHTEFQRRFWTENTFVIGAGQPPTDEDGLQRWFPEAATEHITKVYVSFTVRDLGEDFASSLPSGIPCPPQGSADDGDQEWYPNRVDARQRTLTPHSSWSNDDHKTDPHDSSEPQAHSEMTWLPSPLPCFPLPYLDPSPSADELLHAHNEALTLELHKRWIDKKYALRGLLPAALKELTLDFAECYATDGRWIGDEVAITMPRLAVFLMKEGEGEVVEGGVLVLDIVAPDEGKREGIERILRGE
ncbi:MAG: hypothetical protein LQ344_007405 [Seirophora lacunosa]|nr:MAG: hypothetical protein LQ344_007405 [Seirophora lacunosa]